MGSPVVLITGGIGSGKSIVTRIFKELGAAVYEADARARYLMEQDPLIRKKLTGLFGPEAYLPDGRVNKRLISQNVFDNPDTLRRLNDLVHPAVGQDFDGWRHRHEGAPLLVREAALLRKDIPALAPEKVVYVYAPAELRIERVVRRDTHRSRHDALKIIEQQPTEEAYRQQSDITLVNDDQRMLLPQALEAFAHLC